MSNFDTDLSQEKILGIYLDKIYSKLNFDFKRITDKDSQLKGVDLQITYNGKSYIIDEKSQLHYLNKDLPTFTFELSYFNKQDILKQGWLFDKSKNTHYYFLITGIYLKEIATLTKPEDVDKVKITSISRSKLLSFLEKLNLTSDTLNAYDSRFRKASKFGNNTIKELNPKTQGLVSFSEQYAEKPMNLQLRLKFLIEKGIAKRIYPIN